jgi:hypothetical protein
MKALIKQNENTNVVQALNTKISNDVGIINDPYAPKSYKREASKRLRKLEKLLRDIDIKETNGHKYPDRLYHSGPEPMNVPELLKLIDSVDDADEISREYIIEHPIEDLSGVSVGKDRFEYIDKGWKQAKPPKP